MTSKPPKPKKCAVASCRTLFTPKQPFETWCSYGCGAVIGSAKLAKKKAKEALQEKRETKAKLEKFKGLPYWISETQKVFNQYCRLRDQLAGYPCISSGKPLDWSGNNVDCGHFRSRGSAPHLKFDERNAHSQTKYDNRYLSGNITGYRIGLIARIGLEAVEALESDQTPRKYTIADLQALKAHYAAKIKELKAKQ
ncbi:MAG: recombination protein NinG [Pseudomonadota bacterium]